MKEVCSNELLWLAGVLDGDGCFTWVKKSPQICIQMTDEDVVKRVSVVFGNKYWRVKSSKGHQDTFKVSLTGSKALSLGSLIIKDLSVRRQQKIKEWISLCKKERPNTQSTSKYSIDLDVLRNERKYFSLRFLAKKYGISYETVRRLTTSEELYKKPNKKSLSVFFEFRSSLQEVSEINWIAGILEAEGSFMKGPPSSPNRPTISIQMSDQDSVKRVADFFQVSVQSYQRKGLNKNNETFKNIYLASIRGQSAVDFMKKLKPLMGSRRQLQIEEAISSYNPNAKSDYLKKMVSDRQKIKGNDIQKIKKLIENGNSIRSVAKIYGVAHSTIQSALKRFL